MMRILSIVLLTAVAGLTLALAPAREARVTLLPESRLAISGTSTVNRFTCATDEVDGEGRIPLDAAPRVRAEQSEAWLRVPVETFDCGNRRMNGDFLDALKAKEHPEIRFELADVDLGDTVGDDRRVLAMGQLTIAGNARQVSVELLGRQAGDGRLVAEGSVPLRMTDFGIDPPTALMGLIKAHDHIVVRFDLVAATQPGALN